MPFWIFSVLAKMIAWCTFPAGFTMSPDWWTSLYFFIFPICVKKTSLNHFHFCRGFLENTSFLLSEPSPLILPYSWLFPISISLIGKDGKHYSFIIFSYHQSQKRKVAEHFPVHQGGGGGGRGKTSLSPFHYWTYQRKSTALHLLIGELVKIIWSWTAVIGDCSYHYTQQPNGMQMFVFAKMKNAWIDTS